MKKLQANVSYSLIHAAMWGMYAIIFAFAVNFLGAKGLGLSNTLCSVVLGTTAAASCLLQVVIGELVSRIRKLKLYMATAVVSVLILAGLGGMMTGSWILKLLGMCVVLALLQLVPGMCNSIGMDAIAKGAPATYSVARGVGSLFYALSATFVGVLIERIGESAIPLLSGALGIALIVGIFWFHLCAEKGLAEAESSGKQEKKKDNFLKKNPMFSLFLVGATFLCVSHFLVCTFMMNIVSGVVSQEAVESVQGIATGISAFVELPIMFGFVFLARKLKVNHMLKLAAVMFIAKAVGLWVATGPTGIYLAQATQIIGYGLYAITSVTYAGEVMGKEEAVRAQSYLAATISLGSVVAMSIGGVLLDAFGVAGMLTAATATAVMGALIILISAKTPKAE